MKNNKKALNVLDEFVKQYNIWAESIKNNPRQLQGVYFSTDYGYIYVRNMARGLISGNLVCCLATISLDDDIQKQGILSSFIKHIEENPFAFKELEVENIHVQHLVDFLVKNEFQQTLIDPHFSLPTTLKKNLKNF